MSVTASSYGSDLDTSPETAPGNAVDGMTDTAWQARPDRADGSAGEWIELDVGREIQTSEIKVWLLRETEGRPAARALRVTTQAGYTVTEVKPNEDAQHLAVPAGPTRWFRVSFERVTSEDPVLGAGIREIAVPGVAFRRYTLVPSDLSPRYSRPGAGPVGYVFERERVDPATPFGWDEEPAMTRRFEVPHAAEFRIAGSVTFQLLGDRSRIPPGDTPLDTGCGGGPVIDIDGVRLPTRVTGRWADVLSLRRLPLTVCTADGRGIVTIGPGWHLLTVDQNAVFQTLDSLSILDVAIGRDRPEPRPTDITSWDQERRTVQIGAGERALLAVRENANPSWTAKLDGESLTPVRLDGWQQGWIVPAGAGGTVTIENLPGVSYRRNLIIGMIGVLLLVAMLAVPTRSETTGKGDATSSPLPAALRTQTEVGPGRHAAPARRPHPAAGGPGRPPAKLGGTCGAGDRRRGPGSRPGRARRARAGGGGAAAARCAGLDRLRRRDGGGRRRHGPAGQPAGLGGRRRSASTPNWPARSAWRRRSQPSPPGRRRPGRTRPRLHRPRRPCGCIGWDRRDGRSAGPGRER
jgi:arabinofuranan 3-O-arabinosyltransferase